MGASSLRHDSLQGEAMCARRLRIVIATLVLVSMAFGQALLLIQILTGILGGSEA